jgi:hypothetical protein
MIHKNIEKHWNWISISQNPNITWDIIRAHPEIPWDWFWICSNPMDNGKPDFIRKELQKWFSRSSLKEELMANVWHPKNIDKFKYLDPDTFGEVVDND